MEQLDVAYSNPLVLGLHHHAQGGINEVAIEII
jgi:hypothetical protein